MPDWTDRTASRRYEGAGLGPDDIDVFVIRGTRLSVEFVIGLMADGWSEAAILENYPDMMHVDILACLAHARDTLSSEKVFPSAA